MIREAIENIDEKNIHYKRAVDLLVLMGLGMVPMNPTFLKKYEKDVEAFHVTDFEKKYFKNKKVKYSGRVSKNKVSAIGW